MRKSRFTEKQIIGILQEYVAGGNVSELCRKHGISNTALYKWKASYAGMTVSKLRQMNGLEAENGQLKRLLADAMLDISGLKGLLAKKNFLRLQTAGMLFSGGWMGVSFKNGVRHVNRHARESHIKRSIRTHCGTEGQLGGAAAGPARSSRRKSTLLAVPSSLDEKELLDEKECIQQMRVDPT